MHGQDSSNIICSTVVSSLMNAGFRYQSPLRCLLVGFLCSESLTVSSHYNTIFAHSVFFNNWWVVQSTPFIATL